MYCPLCKSEFRDGFIECSDCHFPLVTTREEAANTMVERIWIRDDGEKLDGFLHALQTAKIRYRLRRISPLKVSFGAKYRIDVLGQDGDQVRQTAHRILEDYGYRK